MNAGEQTKSPKSEIHIHDVEKLRLTRNGCQYSRSVVEPPSAGNDRARYWKVVVHKSGRNEGITLSLFTYVSSLSLFSSFQSLNHGEISRSSGCQHS